MSKLSNKNRRDIVVSGDLEREYSSQENHVHHICGALTVYVP